MVLWAEDSVLWSKSLILILGVDTVYISSKTCMPLDTGYGFSFYQQLGRPVNIKPRVAMLPRLDNLLSDRILKSYEKTGMLMSCSSFEKSK